MTITLSAESKYGYSGQYIARILGRAKQFQFNREFVGNRHGKRNESSSYETDEPGLYETCDVTKHGKDKSYVLVLPWKDDLKKLNSDLEDALKIAKRLDAGETLDQIVAIELGDPLTNSDGTPRVNPDTGKQLHALVYAIRTPGEARRALTMATLNTIADAIMAALTGVPVAEAKYALKLAKERLSSAPVAPERVRIFRGDETKQISGADGSKADPEKYYYEPTDYEGDTLWSVGYGSRAEAYHAAGCSADPEVG